jgi:hypothetical protein
MARNHYLRRYNEQQMNDSEDDEDEPANNYGL